MGKSKKKSKKRSSSSSSSEGENLWVEKSEDIASSNVKKEKKEKKEKRGEDVEKPTGVIKGPMLPPKMEGDNWLMITEKDTDPFGALGRVFKKTNEEKKETAASELERMQKERELNPYWKNGGTGMPEEEQQQVKEEKQSTKSTGNSMIGDGGLTWWTKSLDRCKEMAKTSGKSLEEVAAERYGVICFTRKNLIFKLTLLLVSL